jgi:flagellar motor protein MotB
MDGLLTFPTGSEQLSREQIKVLDHRLAELTPASGELLLIECRGDGLTDDLAELRLAHARAKAVTAYLLAEGSFPRSRLQVRIPADSPASNRMRAGRVDARLLIPLVPH